MSVLRWLEDTSFSAWVGGSPSLLAYPTILVLHTVGMGLVVGTCAMLNLRVLGVGREIPLKRLRGASRVLWTGFAINAATGLALFAIDAEQKAAQPVFWIKLGLVAAALVVYRRQSLLMFGDASAGGAAPEQARTLAIASLVLWAGATVAGRLMAYLV
jgi:hypothetical protein